MLQLETIETDSGDARNAGAVVDCMLLVQPKHGPFKL